MAGHRTTSVSDALRRLLRQMLVDKIHEFGAERLDVGIEGQLHKPSRAGR